MTTDVANAVIDNDQRPNRVQCGLWLSHDRIIASMRYTGGEWVARDDLGGSYHQTSFPGGLLCSALRPIGDPDDPRLAVRIPWPVWTPMTTRDLAVRVVVCLGLGGFGCVMLYALRGQIFPTAAQRAHGAGDLTTAGFAILLFAAMAAIALFVAMAARFTTYIQDHQQSRPSSE